MSLSDVRAGIIVKKGYFKCNKSIYLKLSTLASAVFIFNPNAHPQYHIYSLKG